MDFDVLASSNSLNEITCILCKNFLSYFPIWTKSPRENICGRCSSFPEYATYIRNAAYEAVAQFLKFPCCYKNEGCSEEALPKEIPEHEKTCYYRIVKCPTEEFTKCAWEGSYPDLIQHCHDKHFDIILKNGEFEVDLLRSFECRNLIIQDNTLFFVERKFDHADEVFRCAIYYPSSELKNNKQSCRLSIKGGNRKVSVEFYTTENDCMSFTDLYLGLNRGGIPFLSEAFGHLTIGNEQGSSDINNRDKIILAVKNSLLCSQCSKLTMPPIYQCLVRQITLCIHCEQEHVSKCKTCAQSTFTADINMRNASLEKIAAVMYYPCKNQDQGCCFSGTPDNIKYHQELCLYGNCQCPLSESLDQFLDCQWKGFGQDLKEHIQDYHRDSMVGSEISVALVSDFTYCGVVKFANRLFRLVFVRDQDNEQRFCWTVQIIGSSDENFQYEIELIDKSNCGRRLIMKQSCAPLINLTELFQNDNYYCYCHLDQVESYLSDRYKLTFKVRISK